MYWWVKLGYPDEFEEGKGGFPRTGQVVKYYRGLKMDDKNKAWTQKSLARVLGVTENTIRDIENKDAGMDFERRQFLCKLFGIPPVLLGIITIEQINKIVNETGTTLASLVTPKEPSQRPSISSPVATAPQSSIDPQEYRDQLASHWKTHYREDSYGVVEDTVSRISILYQELPHVRGTQRPQLHELLCSYHQLAANLLRDKQAYDAAIVHLNKALQMAKLLNNDELRALVLFSRGYMFWSAHRMSYASIDFAKAKQYERSLPSYLNSPILMLSGQAQAHIAETEQEKKEALLLIDRGGNLVRTTQNRENPHFIDFSLSRYHLVRTSTLIAVGRNRDALNELELVNLNDHTNVRRQVYNDILQAQAYVNLGEYCRASTLAEAALVSAQDLQSEIYIARVAKIYQQLQQSPYRNSPDVARLDYLLYH